MIADYSFLPNATIGYVTALFARGYNICTKFHTGALASDSIWFYRGISFDQKV